MVEKERKKRGQPKSIVDRQTREAEEAEEADRVVSATGGLLHGNRDVSERHWLINDQVLQNDTGCADRDA